MARQINKLSAIGLSRLKRAGMYADGGGLYLRLTKSGGKFWVFRFMIHGRAREMGLGALHSVSLSEARAQAANCRKTLSEGHDPIRKKEAVRAESRITAAKERTFKECAEAYIEAHRSGWRNSKHIQQWENTLKTYAYPTFGDVNVQYIDVALLVKVLEPIWKTKTETASRLRGRIELVLDWAIARGFRNGENPARWRGHLENLLPHRTKIQRVTHQPALPYAEIGAFMNHLKGQNGTAALCAARTAPYFLSNGSRAAISSLSAALAAGYSRPRLNPLAPSQRARSSAEAMAARFDSQAA